MPNTDSDATAKKTALDEIRRQLFSAKRPPGSILSATGLAQELPHSRTPIREAMEVLAVEGLIDWVGTLGARVREVGSEELVEILRLLLSTKTEVAKKLARHQDVIRLGRLTDLLGEMEAVMPDSEYCDSAKWAHFDLHRSFHLKMAEAAGMSRARAFLSNLFDHFRLFSPAYLDVPAELFQDDVNILKAIERKSLKAARDAVRSHILRTTGRWEPRILPLVSGLD
jgi:DNA-binding GntR family transcriptional regulator